MRAYLLQAGDSDLDAGIAVDLTQAEMQLSGKNYLGALSSLERARRNVGKYPYALHLLYRVYDGMGDVEAMVALLPELRKYHVAGPVELDDLESRAFRDLLEKAAVRGDLELLKSTWKKYPARLKDDEDVHLHYLEAMLACDEVAEVEKDIIRGLKKRWRPALVRLYGRIPRDSAQRQLAVAEAWLKQHESDTELLLCLGRLAMAERQWAKARDYLERSHAIDANEEACLELGRLLMSVGEHTAAATAFREAIELRREPLPALPQPDDLVPDTHRLNATKR